MWLRKRAATSLVTIALVAGATAFTSSASAAQRDAATPHAIQDGGCRMYSGTACFWPYKYGIGTLGEVTDNNSDFTKIYNSTGCAHHNWNDCINSIQNGGTLCTVYFWTGAGYTGRYHSLALGDAVWDFAAPTSEGGYNDPSFDKSISSNHWCTPK